MEQARAAFADYLHEKNLRATPQRLKILETFMAAKGHLTSEELYDIMRSDNPSMGQATVYRTLKLLADAGLAKRVDFNEGVARYEPKFGQEHHDHLICECCRKTLEIVDQRIESLQEELARRHGFRLTGHRMYLYGICDDCRKKGASPSK